MAINLREWFRREALLLFPPHIFSQEDFVAPSDILNLRGHGEVRLIKNGANLQLNGYGSGLGRIMVGGTQVQISNSGPTLAATGLAVNTTYYIYLSNASSPTLEASTTAYSYYGPEGIMVKSGEVAKTLVGMARTTATGPAWVDSDAFRYVLSYFNRRQRGIYVPLTSDKTPTTSSAEITTSAERCYFLTWGDTPTVVGARVNCTHTASNTGLYVLLGLDGTALTNSLVASVGSGASYVFNNSIPPYTIDLSEGLHFIGLHAYNVSTNSIVRGTTSPGTAIQGTIWG